MIYHPKPALDFTPSRYLVGERKLPCTPAIETITKQCRRCSAEFVTRSRAKKRCDACQLVVAAEQQKKANERLKARRQAKQALSRFPFFKSA